VEASCSVCGAPPSSWKQSGKVVARLRLARKPKLRMRTKPSGSRCNRKRRKNSSRDRVINFCSLLWAESLILLLRYSGLRIGDAVACRIDQIQGTRVRLYTKKTGQPIYCPLPEPVVRILESVPRLSNEYFFWTGMSRLHTAVGTWQRTLKRLFVLAGIPGGHAHRFRDTFAVELLLTRSSIEEVAVLLGHSNIKVTQKHYNPWVDARQQQLEATVQESWALDPVLRQIGTRTVRGEEERKTNLLIIGGKGMVPAGGIEPTA
jgi:integrase